MEQVTTTSTETTVKLPETASEHQAGRGIRRRVLTVILSLILIAIVVITTVTVLSARVISQRAGEISSQSLRSQAETYMEQITSSAARENDLILDRANRDVQAVADSVAVAYQTLGKAEGLSADTFWSFDEKMFQIEDGQYMNGKDDLTTVLVPNFQEIDNAVRYDVEIGGYVELVLAGIFENNPTLDKSTQPLKKLTHLMLVNLNIVDKYPRID